MATEKQIKANRENAKRSTGPKTLVGRLKSSRNALRHGLAIPVTADTLSPPSRIVELLAPEGASQLQKLAVVELAQAHILLKRVAAVRKGLLIELEFQSPSHKQMRRLAALERYERRAHRQRRRAADLLQRAETVGLCR
ncbi:hypothetical protein ACVW16_005433 [Bradyrhizobium sp. USDA 4474]